MADINEITENLSELLTNSTNLASVFYDIFFNTTPMDVELQQYDSENVLQTYSIPNRAKDRKIALVGTVEPEGSVTADVGTIYVNTSDDSVYIKVSGNGSTGWNPLVNETAVPLSMVSTDGAMTQNSDDLISTQRAVKTYADTKLSADGNGSQLTNLNASNISSGTLNANYLPTTATVQGNIFNGSNELVKLNSSGQLPAIDGSLLTGLATVYPSFTVNSSNIGADGQPNYLTGTGTSTITLNAGGSYSNVVATFIGGTRISITSNLTKVLTSETGLYFIGLKNSSDPSIYIFSASNFFIKPFAPSLAAYNQWIDTSAKPYILKIAYPVSTPTAWQTQVDSSTYSFIPIGIATLSSGTITNIEHLPLNHNFIDVFNNDNIPFGTISSGSIYLRPNMKHSVTFSGNATIVIPEVPTGQEINIELDIKMSNAATISWSKTITWMYASAPTLSDLTQTYEVILTLKADIGTWEGRWSSKTL